MERDPLQVAWAAGLFEGEGCLTATHQRKADGSLRPKRRVFVRVSSTDRDVLERFQQIIGFGHIYEHRHAQSKPHWKRSYQWGSGISHEVRELIDLFRPYFCARRLARAEQIYAISLELLPHSAFATECPNGHEYTAENTRYEKRNGGRVRRCRICRNADARRWEASRRTG